MEIKYCINPSYQARTQYHHYDDSHEEDKWQLEIYLHALGLMKRYDLKSVVDIGCGSAYKLITYLGEYDTLGLELPVNIGMLRDRYPERKWAVSDFHANENIVTDVIVCADVIEHLVDPDELLNYIKKLRLSIWYCRRPIAVWHTNQKTKVIWAHLRIWRTLENGTFQSSRDTSHRTSM